MTLVKHVSNAPKSDMLMSLSSFSDLFEEFYREFNDKLWFLFTADSGSVYGNSSEELFVKFNTNSDHKPICVIPESVTVFVKKSSTSNPSLRPVRFPLLNTNLESHSSLGCLVCLCW